VSTLRLFVYGTLRRGRAHHAELAGATYEGSLGTEPRYAVIEHAGYPALVAGRTAVDGEVYAVTTEHLARLDAFEGSGYVRAPVLLADGSTALAYFSTARAR
jgi:gamma-glutamylcyclotransferase (GGCT)/AIG2-like uncharacterized protein YtfP